MIHQASLSLCETAVTQRLDDGWPHLRPFTAGIAVAAVQVCADRLMVEARRALPGPYRQGLEDAAALLTGTDPDGDTNVIPLARRTAPDGAA